MTKTSTGRRSRPKTNKEKPAQSPLRITAAAMEDEFTQHMWITLHHSLVDHGPATPSPPHNRGVQIGCCVQPSLSPSCLDTKWRRTLVKQEPCSPKPRRRLDYYLHVVAHVALRLRH